MTLFEIADSIVGGFQAAVYLRAELPLEDPRREWLLVETGDGYELYRDGDSYLVHTPVGMDTGDWDSFQSDFPQCKIKGQQ